MNKLNAYAKEIFEANAKQGFWDVPEGFKGPNGLPPVEYTLLKKAEKIALMHSELSEALEGIRKALPSDKIDGFTAEEEELADVWIRLMDYVGGFNVRLAEAIQAKLAYNKSRPFKHGKKF